VVAREEPRTYPGSRYVDWLIPGIVGSTSWHEHVGSGFRSSGPDAEAAECRLVASPMLKREVPSPRSGADCVASARSGVPLLFGVFVLGLPIRGSIVTTSIVCLVGALAFGGVGLLLASRARTFEAYRD
jgi:hypothetical protein